MTSQKPATHGSQEDAGYIFGIPVTLTGTEAAQLRATITALWKLTYGEAPGEVEQDLIRCRDFFDPAARGYKLRERIEDLPEAPSDIYTEALKLPDIVTNAGGGRLIAGVEARLALGLLEDGYRRQEGGYWVLPPETARAAENQALQVYRSWSMRKLNGAISLRMGEGEVLQATSVGLVLALLVNRVDSPDRAVMRPGEGPGHPIDEALHSAAVAFADSITKGRTTRRSSDSRRLRGGYMLSEARRRLADKMSGYPGAVYIRPGVKGDVIRFLGSDLARRENLTTDQLSDALGRLVDVFRENALGLAGHSSVYERPADTKRLREELLASFVAARTNRGSFPGSS